MCDDKVLYVYTDEEYTLDDPSELRIVIDTSGNLSIEIAAPDGMVNEIWLNEIAVNKIMRTLRLASQEVFA